MTDLFQPLFKALPEILDAAKLTIIGSLIAIVLAMAFAIPAGFGRLSRITVVRSLSTFYVETIRGTPLLLQLLVWSFGVQTLLVSLFGFNVDTALYNLLTELNSNSLFPAEGISKLFFAIFGLSFNYGAYLAEVIRAGILAVDRGQTEAGASLGLSTFQVSRYIILPQALRLMIPPLTNNFITLVQDTSFFFVLGIFELSLRTQSFALATSNSLVRWEFYTAELVIYFIICFSLATISRRLEARGAAPVRRGWLPFRRPLTQAAG